MRTTCGMAVGLFTVWTVCVSTQESAVQADDSRTRAVREVADALKAAPHAAASRIPLSRTPWGDPDLQGVYTNTDESQIPFERPPEFQNRSLSSITPEELTRLRESRRDAWLTRLSGVPAEPGTIGWYENLNAKNSRAWLILDPADGHIPALTAPGKTRADAADARRAQRPSADSYQNQSAYARCISRGLPGSMMPEAYGDMYEVTQGPGVVAIRYEQIHETRVIPLDSRPHVGSGITGYMGDARGHWAGSTLVVETTNFREGLEYFPGALRTAFGGVDSAALRLLERFTPTSDGRLEWSVDVQEPTTWVRPWTFAMSLTPAASGQELYEYACHEGNYSMRNLLGSSER